MKIIEECGLYQELAIAVTQLILETKIEFELTSHFPNCLPPMSPKQGMYVQVKLVVLL